MRACDTSSSTNRREREDFETDESHQLGRHEGQCKLYIAYWIFKTRESGRNTEATEDAGSRVRGFGVSVWKYSGRALLDAIRESQGSHKLTAQRKSLLFVDSFCSLLLLLPPHPIVPPNTAVLHASPSLPCLPFVSLVEGDLLLQLVSLLRSFSSQRRC